MSIAQAQITTSLHSPPPTASMRAIALDASDPAFKSTFLCCKCKNLTDKSSSLPCLSCNNIFHPSCLLRSSSIQRCHDCRVCKGCRTRIQGPLETSAIQCSECKGLFHSSALSVGKPKTCNANAHSSQLGSINSAEWRCLECLKCKFCTCKQPEGTGWSKLKQVSRASFKKDAKWMNANSTCNECYLVEKLGQQCPICKVLYADGDESVPMVTCDSCEAWVHVACDSTLSMSRYHEMTEDESIPYNCPLCTRKNSQIGQQIEIAVDFFTKAVCALSANHNPGPKRALPDSHEFKAEVDLTVIQSEGHLKDDSLIYSESKSNSLGLCKKENSSNCFTMDVDVEEKHLTALKKSHSPFTWVKCLLCNRTEGEDSDWLSPLFPISFSQIPDCLSYFFLPDVFIHQKCAFYASLMCKEASASRFCDFLLQRASICQECNEKGALIYCRLCNAHFHHFCHKSNSTHKLTLEPFKADSLFFLHKSLDRRLLSRFIAKEKEICYSPRSIALKLITTSVIRTSPSLESLQIFNRESQLTKTLILDALSECMRKSISQSPRAFKPLFKNITYDLGACTAARKDFGSIKVVPSQIAGIGVIATRAFAPGETIIEYIGQAIGKVIADKRERFYEQRGMGSCYMFKIDEDCIIDATMTGNRARFINHSCNPNCKTKTVLDSVRQTKKILIYCCRKIEPGEEICYDYKFPLEDAKIPCNCGTVKCRGFMN
jgi:hypothetical protein